MNVGTIIIREVMAIVDPRIVSFIARWPSPCIRSSWPGRTPNPVSSSGAPRNIDGIKSRKVWVIAMDVMKIKRRVFGKVVIIVRDSRDIATRFMCIPGMSPVIVPAIVPVRSVIMKLSIDVEGQRCF